MQQHSFHLDFLPNGLVGVTIHGSGTRGTFHRDGTPNGGDASRVRGSIRAEIADAIRSR